MSEYLCLSWPATSTSLCATNKASERRVVMMGSESRRRWMGLNDSVWGNKDLSDIYFVRCGGSVIEHIRPANAGSNESSDRMRTRCDRILRKSTALRLSLDENKSDLCAALSDFNPEKRWSVKFDSAIMATMTNE